MTVMVWRVLGEDVGVVVEADFGSGVAETVATLFCCYA